MTRNFHFGPSRSPAYSFPATILAFARLESVLYSSDLRVHAVLRHLLAEKKVPVVRGKVLGGEIQLRAALLALRILPDGITGFGVRIREKLIHCALPPGKLCLRLELYNLFAQKDIWKFALRHAGARRSGGQGQKKMRLDAQKIELCAFRL
jgi:hypothetical protein